MGSSRQDKGRGEHRSSTLILPGNAGLAAGRGWGEGRCLAAEVRPYSELAACLSSSRVRGWGRRGAGGGGAGRRRRRGGEAAAESRGRLPVGEGPLLQSSPRRSLPLLIGPVSGRGGGTGGVGVRQEQDTDPQGAASSKLSPQHTSKLEVISDLHLPEEETNLRFRLVQLKVQGCSSLTPVPSPGFCHCPEAGLTARCRASMRTDVP